MQQQQTTGGKKPSLNGWMLFTTTTTSKFCFINAQRWENANVIHFITRRNMMPGAEGCKHDVPLCLEKQKKETDREVMTLKKQKLGW